MTFNGNKEGKTDRIKKRTKKEGRKEKKREREEMNNLLEIFVLNELNDDVFFGLNLKHL